MYTERDALKQRMEQIYEERKASAEEFNVIYNRLRELDAMEETGDSDSYIETTPKPTNEQQRPIRAKRDIIEPFIVKTLKNSTLSLNAKEIGAELERNNIVYNESSLYVMLNKIVEENKHITKPYRGRYAYEALED
ncbi:Rok-like winged helix domain-containing protein [Alkalicoccobacillus porphyridii]|uniref:Uncharacterized protein n=1 Tax=Alkalicoccobacillus porphyridii TaxID=2597270 RepID=A0A554A415_9BACI|nr:hypothetical protein [Alkalicoccobacillus porphyridii]TSB48439.1 hypothetical protein FN960_02475 [Alkalicoccobacillus porphyridii]